MNYGLEMLNKIGSPVEGLIGLFEILEGPREELQFETFRALTFPKEGIEFAFDLRGKMLSAHLFSAGLDGKSQFRRELPFNVKFGDRHADIVEKLGRAPDASGGGCQWEGKEVPMWDRYCVNDALIHFQYSRVDSGVELITLMAKDQVDKSTP